MPVFGSKTPIFGHFFDFFGFFRNFRWTTIKLYTNWLKQAVKHRVYSKKSRKCQIVIFPEMTPLPHLLTLWFFQKIRKNSCFITIFCQIIMSLWLISVIFMSCPFVPILKVIGTRDNVLTSLNEKSELGTSLSIVWRSQLRSCEQKS